MSGTSVGNIGVAFRLISALALVFSTSPALHAQDQAMTYAQPRAIPQRGMSNFDASLRCMDDLLARSDYAAGRPIFIAPLDKEELIGGASTREMIVSALSRMSERSRLFEIHIATNAQAVKTTGPNALVVAGAISAYDKGIGSSGGGGGLSVGPVGLGYRSQTLDSVLSLTLYFQDSQGVVLPLTTQNVSMALKTRSKGGDLSGNVGILGGFVALDFARAEGPVQAVRALIDLGMIQAVGTWAGVPYQRCLTLAQTDPQAIQKARKDFDRMKPADKLHAIGTALTARGLYSGPLSPTVLMPELREAIAAYQTQQQLPSLGLPTFEVYYELYGGRYGSPSGPAVPIVADARNPNLLGLRVSPYGPNFVPDSEGTPLIIKGLRATFLVSAAADAHLVCYYTDADMQTTRIFPNSQRRDDRLQARETILLPGPTDIFTIEPGTVGAREYITCAAAAEPISLQRIARLGGTIQPGAPEPPRSDPAELLTALKELKLDQLSVKQLIFIAWCQGPDGKPLPNATC